MKFRYKYHISGVLMLLLVSLALFGPVSAVHVTPITSLPYTITEPGTYVLEHDFSNFDGPVAINVQAQNVVIDGQNLKIGGMRSPNSIGIRASSYGSRGGIMQTPENLIVKNARISDFATGVLLYQARGSSVNGNVFTSNGEAVTFRMVESSKITRNDFTGNTNGVSLTAAINTDIEENTFRNDGGVGVMVESGSRETNILANTLNSEMCAIQLNSGSTTTTVTGNAVQVTTAPADARKVGIRIDGSSGNVIYNNNFNTFHNVKATNTANIWSVFSHGKNIAGGPVIGGNAWMSPSGNGFSQNVHDSPHRDGFADRPYFINEMNRDVLPLKVPVLI